MSLGGRGSLRNPNSSSAGRGDSAQAAYDVIVVGAGLAGMFAGALAARRGARTLVVARGLGGTHLGPGSIDVWGFAAAGRPAENPEIELERRLPSDHPLARAGLTALRSALREFQAVADDGGYPLVGRLDHNYWLPTALGAARPTCLAPESFVAGEVRDDTEMVLAQFPGFRDFYADLAAANLRAAGFRARTLTLDLPGFPMRRDSFTTDLARRFDDANYRASVANHWRGQLEGVARLGLPAVLGLENAPAARRDLSDRLGIPLFEIPTLPPSVPGMRLFTMLKMSVESAGGNVTIGPGVTGWVANGRAAGVIAETASGPRKYAARSIILATGGFRHGGLESAARGHVRETVFDLPVSSSDEWFEPFYWDAHPYARFGVRTNAQMHPVDARRRVVFPNLFAVGGLLADADRIGEGSREGIDIATAWKAAQEIPNPKNQNPKIQRVRALAG